VNTVADRSNTSNLILGGILVALIAIPACSSHDDEVYTPLAYGENGHCYYVDDPSEIGLLQARGMCPTSWVAYPMPPAWHARYVSYYDSDRYVDTYVVSSRRRTYLKHAKTFEKSNKTLIGSQRKAFAAERTAARTTTTSRQSSERSSSSSTSGTTSKKTTFGSSRKAGK
jgi:hypothetical protein